MNFQGIDHCLLVVIYQVHLILIAAVNRRIAELGQIY